MERFQDLENVKVVSENGKGITRRNANANERVLSWRETAACAGVVTMVTNQEEKSNVVEPTQPHGKKRKTPKQYRLAPPKLAKNREITAADKKKFKEMFITDKSRFHKPQPTFIQHSQCRSCISFFYHRPFYCSIRILRKHLSFSIKDVVSAGPFSH